MTTDTRRRHMIDLDDVDAEAIEGQRQHARRYRQLAMAHAAREGRQHCGASGA
ncbi:MAG: hypothetical protein WCP63_03170 [Cyanobium sp. ELA712]